MRPVEFQHIRQVQPPNRLAQIGLLRSDDPVVVIVHQDQGMNLQTEAFRQIAHPFKEPSSIGVRPIECPSPVPPIHHVIPRPCQVDSQRSRQCPSLIDHPSLVNYSEVTPLPFHHCLFHRNRNLWDGRITIKNMIKIRAPPTSPLSRGRAFTKLRPSS